MLDSRTVTRIDVREIIFQPGQQTGRHLHPCPVVGYIAEGTAFFQREDEAEPRTLTFGSAFYEPPMQLSCASITRLRRSR